MARVTFLFLIMLPYWCFAQTSTLIIDSDPGISVSINEINKGKTDSKTGILFIPELYAGKHSIKLSIYDYVLRDTISLSDSSVTYMELSIITGLNKSENPLNRKLNNRNLKNPEKLSYGLFVDERDNKIYRTIQIGRQTWMAENLNFNYGRGCYLYPSESSNGNIHGRLYDWKTAMIACPKGWHIASDEDWASLEIFYGMEVTASASRGWRNMDDEGSLKSIVKWNENGNGSNASGFSGLPGGYRDEAGVFFNEGNYAYFWTGTAVDDENALYRVLTYDIPNVGRFRYSKEYAFSVRCVKNE